MFEKTGAGVLIKTLTPGGAAAKAGYKEGDLVVLINKKKLKSASHGYAVLKWVHEWVNGQVNMVVNEDESPEKDFLA